MLWWCFGHQFSHQIEMMCILPAVVFSVVCWLAHAVCSSHVLVLLLEKTCSHSVLSDQHSIKEGKLFWVFLWFLMFIWVSFNFNWPFSFS